MPIDAFFIQGLCTELDRDTKGARIEKIYMPRRDQIILNLRGTQRNGRLMISVGSYPAVWITSEKYENPETPVSFFE